MNTELGRSNDHYDEERHHLLRSHPQSVSLWPWFSTRLRRHIRRFTRLASYHLRPLIKGLLFAAISIIIFTPILASSYTKHPKNYETLNKLCAGPHPVVGCANPNNQTVFISAILLDRDGRLANGLWGQRLLSLIHLLGPANVLLSIYENDSGKTGEAALEVLKKQVPCRHHIVSEPHVSLAGFPSVALPDGTTRVKRVAYLAELRNRALRPLDKFDSVSGTRFDKILFLNDISFNPLDAAHLLFSTNKGNYLAACGLDFFEPHRMYDIYAMRDADGYASYQMFFPFFGIRGRGLSRADVLAQKDAVRVNSCWGGIMAVQGKYVQNLDTESRSAAVGQVINPDHPSHVSRPIRFRHEPEPYYDACECCLFSADLRQVARRDGIEEAQIYVNPYVRVAYTERVFRWTRIFKHWERLFKVAYDIQTWFMPKAENPWREVEEGEVFTEEIWDGQEWRLTKRIGRSGLFCGVREMQVLRTYGQHGTKNGYGWTNTRMPPGQTLKFRSWWGETLPANWRSEHASTDVTKKEKYFYKEYD